MNETLQVIKNRRSTRKFKPEQIKEEELEAILEAGIYAPSAHNDQPWNFTVIQNKELMEELNVESKEKCKDFPDELIRKMANNERFNIFYGAPTVIIVSGRDNAIMPQVDCAAATENMLLAAESLDIGGCWNGFVSFLFNSEKGDEYKEKLNIPRGYTPYYGVALGYKKVRVFNAPARKGNVVQYIK
ncbi:nitroreductase [Anaeromicrobium sediminis]|uniref:Nitroreductase n=1 Tax=Anaeromicrobium sediminis TaxID=1478221 RepID=A0A267MGG9_9FIRM|nr:nitroreductase [Anaeromicrobium sediminis]